MGKRGPAPTPIHKREVFVKLTIDNLKAAPYNPRKIDGPSLKALGFSLQEFGDISGITWNKRTGNLVCGHQRLEALKKDFRLLEVEGNEIVASKPKGGSNGAKLVQRFPVRVVDWDLSKEKAANVAANSRFLAGEFTDDLGDILKGIADDLPKAFEKLRLNEFDLLSMGLDEGKTDPDAVPNVPKKPKTKTGDLYLLGDHRLLCGDATKQEDVEKLMDGQKADMVFTDPPYGVNYEGGCNSKKRDKLIGDNSAELYPLFLSQITGIVKETAPLYLWFAGNNGGLVYTAIQASGYTVRALIVWNKLDAHYGNFMAQYMQKHEPCLYCVKEPPEWVGPSNETTVWDIKQPSKNEYHPTQKPVALAIRAMGNHTVKIILDLFGGSGSTLIACEQTNRKCYMMEIDPHYCDVIVKRWEDFTGKKARHG